MGRPYLTELVTCALEARMNATVQAQDVQVDDEGQLADEEAADVATTQAALTDGIAADVESAADGAAADGATADGAAADGADADGAAAASENSKNRCWFCQASAPEHQLRKCRGCLKVRYPQCYSIHLEFNAKLISRKT